MAIILFKWLFAGLLLPSAGLHHPIYVSVTEIEHNTKEKIVEISCKVYTDDFEKALRNEYKTAIDIISPKDKQVMNRQVNNYIQKHLSLVIDNKPVALEFVGYENIEEGIYCYFQVSNISSIKKISITDNILYDYKKEQVSVLHVTINGERKSTKLNNPVDHVVFNF